MKYLLLFLFATCGLHAYCQSSQETYFDSDKKFFGGLVVGINASQVDGDSYGGYHKVGLNIGGIVFWKLSEPVGMSVEMLYSQKGSRAIQEQYDPYAGPYFSKYKINLNYAEVPILFHYSFSSKYQFGLGASYNALISSKEDIPGNYYQPPSQGQTDFSFNRHTVDAIASINVIVLRKVILNARYQYGITPLRNWDKLPGIGFGNQLNNMFTFRVAYFF